ncbi:hypothetical protein M758_UG177500 [Ceratodon purpureus]|nr:hypothetical protein M758_UG177500 [Ceratodon purpureus]
MTRVCERGRCRCKNSPGTERVPAAEGPCGLCKWCPCELRRRGGRRDKVRLSDSLAMANKPPKGASNIQRALLQIRCRFCRNGGGKALERVRGRVPTSLITYVQSKGACRGMSSRSPLVTAIFCIDARRSVRKFGNVFPILEPI